MDKKKLLKSSFYISLIILLTTISSKTIFKSGETLQEYVQKNPNVTYTNKKAPPKEKETISSNSVSSSNFIDRVIYQEDFYYEPIHESIKKRIQGISFPENESDCEITYDDLRYVHLLHYNFNGDIQEGELICNKEIAQDLVEIFYELYFSEYQIESIKLIDEYDGNDDLSMENNNTSCFNYRVVDGSDKLSKHAYGLAIDVNPLYNPCVKYLKDGKISVDPENGEPYVNRDKFFPYKIDENDLCFKLFDEHGFTWGGNWNSLKDYQHFQK